MKFIKKNILFLICLLSLSLTLFAQWTQKTSMYNYGRRSTFGCSLNGKGYTGLGMIYNSTYVKDFWEYDTLANTWTQKANYPGAGLLENTSFAINDKLYVCLGFSNSHICQNDLWEYNPTNDTWTQKASFPGTARYGARAFVIGDSAFVIGGSPGGPPYLSDMYMFNPSTNIWKVKASFPGGSRAFGTAFTIAGYGYFGLGASNSTTVTNDFWKYNPTTDTWSTITNFPGYSRSAPINFVVNNKAYVGTGDNLSPIVYYNDFYIYDPSVNSWQSLNGTTMLPERSGAIAFSFGNTGYVGLGLDEVGLFTDLWHFNQNSITNVSDNKNNDKYLNVFPNPSSYYLILENFYIKTGKYVLTLTSMDGKEVLSKNLDFCNSYKLDLTSVINGIYLLTLQNDTERMIKKIIVQR